MTPFQRVCHFFECNFLNDWDPPGEENSTWNTRRIGLKWMSHPHLATQTTHHQTTDHHNSESTTIQYIHSWSDGIFCGRNAIRELAVLVGCSIGLSVTKTKCECFRYSAPAHPSASGGEHKVYGLVWDNEKTDGQLMDRQALPLIESWVSSPNNRWEPNVYSKLSIFVKCKA